MFYHPPPWTGWDMDNIRSRGRILRTQSSRVCAFLRILAGRKTCRWFLRSGHRVVFFRRIDVRSRAGCEQMRVRVFRGYYVRQRSSMDRLSGLHRASCSFRGKGNSSRGIFDDVALMQARRYMARYEPRNWPDCRMQLTHFAIL